MSASNEVALERERKFDALIDSLANRLNKAPYITGTHPDDGPIFPERYDEAEQHRILDVARDLCGHSGNEVWPRLVARTADERYALSYEDGQGVSHNLTVGEICAIIAYRDLEFAYTSLSPLSEPFRRPLVHLVSLPGERYDGNPASDRFLRGCPSGWPPGARKRKEKQMYELQVEIYEVVIADPGGT